MADIVLTMREAADLVAEARARGLIDEDYEAARHQPAPPRDRVAAGGGPLPAVVSLRQWQSPNTSQGNRGTCYAFATAAAMEAAVNRSFGRVVDLSEQYLFHVYKTSDPLGARTADAGFDTGTSLLGNQGNSNCVEAAYRMPVPLEGSAPYLDQTPLETVRGAITAANPAPDGNPTLFGSQRQLDEFEWDDGVVPLYARHRANYRVTAFHPVGAGALGIQAELAAGREVVMDIPGHTLLVIGYDTTQGLWEIKNSWNDTAPIWVPVGSPLAAFVGGYAVDGVEQSYAAPHPAWLGRWQLSLGGRSGEVFIHRTTDRRDRLGQAVPLDGESTATLLGQAYLDNGTGRDVNGWLEDGGRRLVMYLAPDTTPRPFGSREGERLVLTLSDDWMSAGSAAGAVVAAALVRPQRRVLAYGPVRVADADGERTVARQPSITSWGEGRLDVFLGRTGGLVHTYHDDEGWGGWERLGGARTGSAVGVGAVSCGRSRLDAFLVDERGRLHHAWHDAPKGWGDWDDLGAGLAVGMTPGALGMSEDQPEVYAISSSGGLLHSFSSPASSWQEWVAVDLPGDRVLAAGVSATATPEGEKWLASVDRVTRRPLLRHFDVRSGWGPWTELATVPARAVPAVTTTVNHFQKAGAPPARTAHVFWLPEAGRGDELVHETHSSGARQTSTLTITSGTPVGVAAASWGGERLDCVVVLERADGDLYRVDAIQHLWSDDAGTGFGSETMEVLVGEG